MAKSSGKFGDNDFCGMNRERAHVITLIDEHNG